MECGIDPAQIGQQTAQIVNGLSEETRIAHFDAICMKETISFLAKLILRLDLDKRTTVISELASTASLEALTPERIQALEAALAKAKQKQANDSNPPTNP